MHIDMGTPHHRSGASKRSNDGARLVMTTILGIVFGFFIGVSFPSFSDKIKSSSRLISSFDGTFMEKKSAKTLEDVGSITIPKIYVPTNPRGAEVLPPGIVVPETDFYLRRLWGEPSEDLKKKPKYLVTFTVGLAQKDNINAAVKKFSEDFQILLFHYDGSITEWDQFEWSKRAIHVGAPKQTKWETKEKPGWCSDPHLHPCAAFVEIMAPVFSRDAWRCVWHMIQNDLVHGWGLDFALRRCVDPPHEKNWSSGSTMDSS